MRRIQMAVFGVALIGLLRLAYPILKWTVFFFKDPREDMAHGWFVPLFSLYLLWQRRRRLVQAVGKPSLAGACLTLLGLALLWMGERGGQPRLTQVAVYGLFWAVPFAVLGRGVAGLLAFPVVFLVFTVPLGFMDFFTVRLRLLTSMFSEFLLNGIGIPVRRVGTGLHCLSGEGFALDVADPCSGLRSIFAMAAMTAAYAHLTLRENWRRWLLFFCAVPLAVIGNMARIFTIALVAMFFGQAVGTGFYHDYSGYLVFIVGTLLMMQAGAWMARIKGRRGGAREAEAPERRSSVAAPWRAGRLVIALVPILAMMGLAWLLPRMPVPVLESQDFLASALPELPGYRAATPRYCQNEQCRRVIETEAAPAAPRPETCPDCGGPLKDISLGEATLLPTDTLLMKRNYYAQDHGHRFQVTVVVNGASRQSIHRPERCLPSQGFSMERTDGARIALSDGPPLPVKLVEFRRGLAGGMQEPIGQVYFFVSAHHLTASHYVRMFVSIRDRALFNRVTRWAMVTVVGEPPFNTPERVEDVRRFLDRFYPRLRNPGKNEMLRQEDRGS